MVEIDFHRESRNPLESGQCFLRMNTKKGGEGDESLVSQSPRIGSMFLTLYLNSKILNTYSRRNPLESGQCFLQKMIEELQAMGIKTRRNPLESGQCFLQHPSFFTHYRKLNTPFAGTSLFLYFPFPSLTYLLH